MTKIHLNGRLIDADAARIDPAAEYEESLTKAKAMIEVLTGAAS